MGRRNTPAAICLLHAVAGCFTMANAQAQPPQQLTETVSRTVSAVITVAISAFFVLVFLCVLVNQCRRSEDAGQGAGEGGRQGSIGRRGRGLDPARVAALPIVTYVEIRKHKSGVLECAVCLTEFDNGDDVRLLPQCSHAFHPDCIDPWLEGHVTCPLCRANLEKETAPAGAPPSPEQQPQTPEAVAVRVEEVESDEDERREEAVELERLRSVRRAARMSRSHSTGHSLSMTSAPAPAEVGDDHERFTVRLPPHVREEVLKSRRLRHATSLVVGLGGSSCEGSSRGGGGSWHGARRWPSYLARTVSWARGGGEGSVRKGGVGAETGTKGTAVPP